VRARFVLLCLSVTACSSAQVLSEPPSPPTDTIIAGGIRAAFAETKMPGTPLVSPIRAAARISAGDWIMCFRSSASEQPRSYAAFFKDDKYVSSRLAVIIDGCDRETYTPLP
jgi:hypothetical protein